MKTSNKILSITYFLGFVVAVGLLMAAKSNMVIPEMITGNGNITTVEKSVPSFSMLKVGNNIDIKLIPSTTPFINIKADAQFQEYLLIEDNEDHLYIGVSRAVKLQDPKPFSIELGIQNLKEINTHGDSFVRLDSSLRVEFMTLKLYGASRMDLPLKAGQINLEINGASQANLKGTAGFLDTNISGASSLEAQDLVSDIVHIQVSGASNANVQAIDFLKANASGASNVRYVGTPKQLNDNYNGAASIRSID